MKKIAVFGNSHLNAIKRGWDSIKSDYDGIELIFFGAPAGKIGTLTLCDGVLSTQDESTKRYISQSSGGITEIVLNEYQGFILVGLEFDFLTIVDVYARHRLYKDLTPKHQLISKAAFDETILGKFRESIAMRIAKFLKSSSSEKILLMPAPFPSQEIVEKQKPKWDNLEILQFLRAENSRYMETLSKEAGIDYFLEQPEFSIENYVFTKPELLFEDPRHALHHTNAKFGEIMLKSAFDCDFLKS